MKLILTTLLLLGAMQILQAQIFAVTEIGDEVILYDNGTWRYINDSVANEIVIPMNEQAFEKDKKASFLAKSKKLNIGVWINPKEWSFAKSAENGAAELQFQKKGEDLYGMIITEKVQIPLMALKNVAIENAKGAAADLEVEHQEYRTVNGIKVLLIQMSGTIQGMRFTYYGYYYSNENGTTQLLTYTFSSLFDEYKEGIEAFLNGLVEL